MIWINWYFSLTFYVCVKTFMITKISVKRVQILVVNQESRPIKLNPEYKYSLFSLQLICQLWYEFQNLQINKLFGTQHYNADKAILHCGVHHIFYMFLKEITHSYKLSSSSYLPFFFDNFLTIIIKLLATETLIFDNKKMHIIYCIY